MNPEKLNMRIAQITMSQDRLAATEDIRQLIRDCIEAVTPHKIDPDAPSLGYKGDVEGRVALGRWRTGRNSVIDTIKQNTKELLG